MTNTNPQQAVVTAPSLQVPVNLGSGATAPIAKMTESQVKRFTAADAWDRAWRTFKTGVGLDIGIALVIVLVPAFTDIHWTPLWWTALLSALGKSVLQAVASYYYRKWVTPKVGVKVKS